MSLLKLLRYSAFILLNIFSFALSANDRVIKEEIDSLLELSKSHKINVKIEESVRTTYLALKKSNEINYSEGRASAYLGLAQTLFYLGNYEKAFNYLTLTENESSSAKNKNRMFEISRIRGQIFSYLNLNDKALREFFKCKILTNDLKPEELKGYALSLTYENLVVVYNNIHNDDSVYYYMNKNKELLELMDETYIYRNLVNLYTSFGDWYTSKKDFDLAVFNFSKAIDLADKYHYDYRSRTYMYMGDMFTEQQKNDLALCYYHRALNNINQTGIKGEFISVYSKIFLLYDKLGILDSAKIYREKGLLIEHELHEEREKCIGSVLDFFIKEEKKQQQAQRRKILTIISISAICLLSFSVFLFIRTKNKLLLRKARLREELTKTIEEIRQDAKVLEKKLNSSFDEIVTLAKNNDHVLPKRFKEVYPEITTSLLKLHPDLTYSEFILCIYIFLNFSTKDIATFIHVEHRSVQTKKNRLRKKLNLPTGASIEAYLDSLNKSTLNI